MNEQETTVKMPMNEWLRLKEIEKNQGQPHTVRYDFVTSFYAQHGVYNADETMKLLLKKVNDAEIATLDMRAQRDKAQTELSILTYKEKNKRKWWELW